MRTYNNRWITEDVINALSECSGRILDLGGGLAPYYRADVIVDIAPYDPDRLADNAWPLTKSRKFKVESEKKEAKHPASLHLAPDTFHSSPPWPAEKYVQLDATREKLPFADGEFDLGLCSHMLEDIEDPFFALEELNRVAKKVAIVSTSRILEQTRGIDHPRKCGYEHHKWMLEHEGDHVTFTGKTGLIEEKGCHIWCPPGRIMTRRDGVFFHSGADVKARERHFRKREDEIENLSSYVDRFQSRRAMFEMDKRAWSPEYWIWRFKQLVFGAER